MDQDLYDYELVSCLYFICGISFTKRDGLRNYKVSTVGFRFLATLVQKQLRIGTTNKLVSYRLSVIKKKDTTGGLQERRYEFRRATTVFLLTNG